MKRMICALALVLAGPAFAADPTYKAELAILGPDGNIGAVAGEMWLWDSQGGCAQPGSPCFYMDTCGTRVWLSKPKIDDIINWIRSDMSHAVGIRRIGGNRFCTMTN